MTFAAFDGILDRIRDSAGVDTIYGDPIEAHGRTIIPVARVAYGFGGGFGTTQPDEDTGGDDEGGGLGGGVSATPVGIVEMTDADTRLIRFTDRKRVAGAALLGLLIGILVARR